jgi:hypothetical protein
MKKKFDCVQMKRDIQHKLMREEQGLSVEERNRRTEQKVLADPILGPWFRKVKARQPAAPSAVAEGRAVYRAKRQRRK